MVQYSEEYSKKQHRHKTLSLFFFFLLKCMRKLIPFSCCLSHWLFFPIRRGHGNVKSFFLSNDINGKEEKMTQNISMNNSR